MFRFFKKEGPNLVDTLSALKKKALRKRVWFSALTGEERLLASLLQRHVKIVKNSTLAMVMARMIVKLVVAVRNSFINMIERIGRPVAESYTRAARAMGWKSVSWDSDHDVIRWLGLTVYYSGRRIRGIG